MEKTKLGISVGLMGAITYFVCLFGGYVGAIIVVGYILLAEKNEWLRKTGVKAAVLTVVFSLLPALINLLPNVLGVIDGILDIFGGSFAIIISTINPILSVIILALSVVESILFVILGLSALSQGSMSIPVVDDIVKKNMEDTAAEKAE